MNAVEWVFISASNELGAFESGAVARSSAPCPPSSPGGVAMVGIAALWTQLFPALVAHGPARGSARRSRCRLDAWSPSTARRSGRTTSAASRATFYYSRYGSPTVAEAEARARRARRRRSAALPVRRRRDDGARALAAAAGRHDRARRGLLLRHGRHLPGAREAGASRYVEFDQTGAAARRRAARLARGAVEPVPDDARPRGRGARIRRRSSSTRPSRRRSTCGRSSTAPTSSLHSATKYLAGHDDALLGAVVCRDRRRRRAARVPHRHGHRRRARSRVAAAARPEDARGARAAPDRDGDRCSPSGCARTRRCETVRYPGFGGLLSFDVADGDAARRVETSTR